jgi:hypothetical protein
MKIVSFIYSILSAAAEQMTRIFIRVKYYIFSLIYQHQHLLKIKNTWYLAKSFLFSFNHSCIHLFIFIFVCLFCCCCCCSFVLLLYYIPCFSKAIQYMSFELNFSIYLSIYQKMIIYINFNNCNVISFVKTFDFNHLIKNSTTTNKNSYILIRYYIEFQISCKTTTTTTSTTSKGHTHTQTRSHSHSSQCNTNSAQIAATSTTTATTASGKVNFEKLNREKCELIASLNYIKHKIQEIEMRQNEAIRDVCVSFSLL